MGLAGLLRARAHDIVGIPNGIDIAVWDPTSDPNIPAHFSSTAFARRPINKAALQRRFGLEQISDALLLGVVSRISWQKGLDLLLEILTMFSGKRIQLALLGSGDPDLQQQFRREAEANPASLGVVIGYDEALAHLIQAGSDALVVPSRFEPCGLTQLCALRYGTVPIVSRVGGLEDTVSDPGDSLAPTGFKFAPVTAENLAWSIQRAHDVYRDRPVWQKMQTNGMNTDVSWHQPAKRYAELYREIAEIRSV